MKYQINQRVAHLLTNEEFMVIGYETGNRYKCVNRNYEYKIFEESELISR